MEEKKEPKVIRRLLVNFDKQRLHASIMLHMRRMRIPSNIIGADLLKGVVFIIIQCPEISIDEAVLKILEASKLPGKELTLEDGYEYIIEVLEVSSKEDLPEERNLEINRVLVKRAVDSFITELRKEFCYEIAIKTLDGYGKLDRNSIGYDLVKSMLFKKLYIPESTFQCMLEYSLRRAGWIINGRDMQLSELFRYLSKFIAGKNEAEKEENLKLFLVYLENKAYEKYPYDIVE